MYAIIEDSGTQIKVAEGDLYQWDKKSTYIQEPPFFTNFGLKPGEIYDAPIAKLTPMQTPTTPVTINAVLISSPLWPG